MPGTVVRCFETEHVHRPLIAMAAIVPSSRKIRGTALPGHFDKEQS